ncbi:MULTISPECIES: DUF6463 family protein [unclassified Nonomuraea]|uniref:DUF6463 family protein n=1 Tax=Nonomuraea sp. NPDC003804 TaxID=3154547 RepID=UPI0033A38170
MNGLNRWVPRLIIGLAVLHFGWAFLQPNAWAAIAADGFFRGVADTALPDFWVRESSVWFMISGIAFLALGTMSRHAVRTTGRVPAQLGWYMLAMGVPLCVFYFPVTGSWPMLAIGVLALIAARRPEGAGG